MWVSLMDQGGLSVSHMISDPDKATLSVSETELELQIVSLEMLPSPAEYLIRDIICCDVLFQSFHVEILVFYSLPSLLHFARTC